nr:MAG TPA: E10-like protein [Caudoviricetes sp.]
MLRKWNEVIDIGFNLQNSNVHHIHAIDKNTYILYDKDNHILCKESGCFVNTLRTFLRGLPCENCSYQVSEVIDNAFTNKEKEFHSGVNELLYKLVQASYTDPSLYNAVSVKYERMLKVLKEYL